MSGELITVSEEQCGAYCFEMLPGHVAPHVIRCTRKAGHEGLHSATGEDE